ncbi:MAG TPA: hypothetical protein VM305_08280 [Candidatus Limnocylindrales bacterium]|nr:hypothetical protein [Candidatus Limnocylindrales bacterium]
MITNRSCGHKFLLTATCDECARVKAEGTTDDRAAAVLAHTLSKTSDERADWSWQDEAEAILAALPDTIRPLLDKADR